MAASNVDMDKVPTFADSRGFHNSLRQNHASETEV